MTPPRVVDVVRRPRLLDRLEPGSGCRIVWIAGAPGSGKTTLAADRVHGDDFTGLWYRVDPSDRDLGSFFHYLALSARNALPRRRLNLPVLTPEYELGTEVFAHEFFRRLYSRVPEPFVLVLDDFHAVPRNSALSGLLPVAVDELPGNGLLIVASRQGPTESLARYAAAGELQLLDGEELLFTPGETRSLLERLGSHASAERLQERTRGWAAGLVLMASLDTSDSPQWTAPEVLVDYFSHEVLNRLPAACRRLLAVVSVLSEVPAPVIGLLAEDKESESAFEELARRGLFVYELPGQRAVYVLHPLFRELLAEHAAQVLPEDELRAARRRAAVWMEKDFPEEAAGLYSGIGDWDGLARVVDDCAAGLIREGREHTIEKWAAAVPETERRSRPWLGYWLGQARLHNDPGGALNAFESAFEVFDGEADREGTWLSWAGAIEARFLAQRSVGELGGWADMYPELLARFPNPDRRLKARIALAMSTALIYGATGHPDAERWGREASYRAIRSLDPEAGLKAYLMRIALACWQGRFHEAARLVGHLRRLERVVNPPPVVRLMVDIADALLALYTMDHDHAMDLTARAAELADRHGVHVLDGHIIGIGANAAVESGMLEDAEARLNRLAAVVESDRHNESAYYLNVAALHALAAGAVDRARRLAEDGLERVALSGMPLGAFTVQATYARVLQGAGDLPQAVNAARTAFELAGRLNSPYCEFGAGLLLADMLAGEDGERADAVLARALETGRRQGFRGSVHVDRACHKRACIRALRMEVETAHVQAMIRHLGLDCEDVPLDLESWPWPVKVYTLGRFEVEYPGKDAGFRRKTQRRPRDMLCELLVAGSSGIPADSLADALWPDADGDAARRSLDTTIHRLRRMLGSDLAVEVADGRVRLNPALTWSDAAAVESLITAVDWSEEAESLVRRATRVLSMYGGAFLSDHPRAARRRIALQVTLARWIDACCARLADAGAMEEALWICEAALEREPHAESLYHTLMRLAARHEGENGVRAAYDRCRSVLEMELGTSPSEETARLASRLTAKIVGDGDRLPN